MKMTNEQVFNISGFELSFWENIQFIMKKNLAIVWHLLISTVLTEISIYELNINISTYIFTCVLAFVCVCACV